MEGIEELASPSLTSILHYCSDFKLECYLQELRQSLKSQQKTSPGTI